VQQLDCFETALATAGTCDNYDEIEPPETTNEYREASRRALSFIFSLVEYLASYRNPKELEVRFWAVTSALQHPACEGLADRELSEMLETTRQNLSKHLTNFERLNGLPPGLGQKGVAARVAYAHAHGNGDNKTRTISKQTALRYLSSAIVYLDKVIETHPLSDWPEAEQDVLRQRVERLNELIA
jgi:hypothetical protein